MQRGHKLPGETLSKNGPPEDKKLFEKKGDGRLDLNKTECGFFTSLKLIPDISELKLEEKIKVLDKVENLIPPKSSSAGVDILNKIHQNF